MLHTRVYLHDSIKVLLARNDGRNNTKQYYKKKKHKKHLLACDLTKVNFKNEMHAAHAHWLDVTCTM